MRYFIITWKSNGYEANLDYEVEGGFPSKWNIRRDLIQYGLIKPGDQLTITNIIELTESDYKDWND